MAERGLVEVTHQGVRGSRTYAATNAGRAELRRWLMSPADGGKVRNEHVLRIFLLFALEPADALVVLRRVAGQSAAEAAELRRVRAEAGPGVPVGRAKLGQLAAEFGLRQHAALHDWAQWAIAQLEDMAQSPVGKIGRRIETNPTVGPDLAQISALFQPG